jgi:hypothetical protein
MRRAWAVGAVLAVGCQGLERPNDHWMMQIETANATPDLNDRGGRLAMITESAAYGGDPVAARYALAQLGNGPQRDELAARCAGLFAARDPEAARLFVREIDDPDVRSQALARLEDKPRNETPQPNAAQPDGPR